MRTDCIGITIGPVIGTMNSPVVMRIKKMPKTCIFVEVDMRKELLWK
jgi:hypothetical protein